MEEDEEKIDWNDVIRHIAGKVLKRYPFLEEDVVRSATHEGGWQAFLKFDFDKCKVEKVKYVLLKGFFETVDILRKEKWLFHTGHEKFKTYNMSSDEDKDEDEDYISLSRFTAPEDNFDKVWFELTDGLEYFDENILRMRFIEKQSMKDMRETLNVCHRTLQRYIYEARKNLCRLQNISDTGIRLPSKQYR